MYAMKNENAPGCDGGGLSNLHCLQKITDISRSTRRDNGYRHR